MWSLPYCSTNLEWLGWKKALIKTYKANNQPFFKNGASLKFAFYKTLRWKYLQKIHQSVPKICSMCWSQDLTSCTLLTMPRNPHLLIYFSCNTNAVLLHILYLWSSPIADIQLIVLNRPPLCTEIYWWDCLCQSETFLSNLVTHLNNSRSVCCMTVPCL